MKNDSYYYPVTGFQVSNFYFSNSVYDYEDNCGGDNSCMIRVGGQMTTLKMKRDVVYVIV
nr:6215_t:CDS:2 [Entrophospora candida]